MLRSQSINQIHLDDALPNFRSLGVILRALLLVNGIAVLLTLLHSITLHDFLEHLLLNMAMVQPVLLSSLLLLYLLNPWLRHQQYRLGLYTVTLIVIIITLGIVFLDRDLYLSGESDTFNIWRYIALSSVASITLLQYFRWRFLILSPAIFEARFQALQARIRPHFLFNCINSVLSIVRNEPRRAETALEDMSDLFRMAMDYGNELVPLSHEIRLSRQYLALEQLRLGNRLTAKWHIDSALDDALVPPLILQPLLENSVYHGIEPLPNGGIIDIRLTKREDELHINIYNPRIETESNRVGNKFALTNIRERLSLLFDIEANYTVEKGNDFYHVHIVMPYVKKELM